MIRLQLRTPGNETIEDVVSELALAILESLKRELDSIEVPTETFSTLEKRVALSISPYLHAFDACGKYPVCREGIEGKALPDPKDHIYILHLPNGFDPLVQAIASEMMESIQMSLDFVTVENLKRRILFSLQRELDHYLYWNPACGQEEVCRTSQPVAPWSGRLEVR